MKKEKKLGNGNGSDASICSLAVAALLVFKYDDKFADRIHYSAGDTAFADAAIDRSGREHLGVVTSQAVARALAASPYWEADGWASGRGGRRVRAYIPSDRGEGKF